MEGKMKYSFGLVGYEGANTLLGKAPVPLTIEEAQKVQSAKLLLLEMRGKAPVIVEAVRYVVEMNQWALQMIDKDNGHFYQCNGKGYGKTWRLWARFPSIKGWMELPW